MEQIRAFISIELPVDLKQEMAQLLGRLQKTGDQRWIKWVDPYNIHLTVKFLGNVSGEILKNITKAMENVVTEIPQFNLKVSGLGVFPNVNQVRVVWIGIGGELDKLNQLQTLVENNLLTLGFIAESHAFVPHLTLARLRDQTPCAERQRLGQLIASTNFETSCTVQVRAMNLTKSQLTKEGAVYSVISSVSLGNPLSTIRG
jgi:2'-5' RNA ligase